MIAKHFRSACAGMLMAGFLALPQATTADDTDLFLINPAIASQRPNVLIILDNTANWSPMFTAEKAALVSVIAGDGTAANPGLTDQFNVGLMMFVETGGTAPCNNGNVDGSYVRFGIRQMTTPNKTALKDILNGLDVNNDKSNNAMYGLTMNEARQYFAGANARSGHLQAKRDFNGNTCPAVDPPTTENPLSSSSDQSYESPIGDSCQKNFIIFISNGKANDNAAATTTSNTLLSGLGGDSTTIPLTPNGSESNSADEWARFLANNDQNSVETGDQTVFTYAVLVKEASAPAGQYPEGHTALMKSMAGQGKGKFFQVSGSTSSIADALNKIFQEVQAVNSVFASSTLPVSVNVRGTFLNQVYMGVFRPDPNSAPRWAGNLKQYKLAFDSNTNTVFLADKNGAAVENTVTGFVSPTVTSIWTTAGASPGYWASSYTSGFYDYSTAQSSGGQFDAPDGDLVEKGGAAQHLRGDFASGRTLYTCAGGCASSGSALTLFNTLNSSITAPSLGIVGAQTLSSLTRSGSTATATFAAAHGYLNGQFVTISGANQNEYNGTFAISTSGPSSTTFTYTVAVNPAPTATGTITSARTTAGSIAVDSITRSGTTATATVAAGHGFGAGPTASVLLSGADQPEYNGVKTVTIVDANTFTYTVTVTPATPASVGSATATIGSTIKSPTAITRSGTTVTLTVASNNKWAASVAAGQQVSVAGVTPTEYNGVFTIASINASRDTITYNLASLGPSSPATGSLRAELSSGVINVDRLNRNIATCLGGLSFGDDQVIADNFCDSGIQFNYNDGDQIVISGADQAEYNGTFTVTRIDGWAFRYTVTVNPTTPATGTISSSTDTVTREQVIDWFRGHNVRQEDNPDNNASSVRGYIHGDVLHSRPAVVNYNRTNEPVDRDIRVFYGANDGIVHAIKGGNDDADGDEKWGFVLPEHFSKFRRAMEVTPTISSSNPKSYFVDGPLSIYSRDIENPDDGRFETSPGNQATGDLVYLYMGMRRGGRFVYALDVSSPDAPTFLWKKDNTSTGYFELGQSWSELKPVNIRKVNPSGTNSALIFGLGYDPTANDASPQLTATMGRGVMVVDAWTGVPIWQAGPRDPSDTAQVPVGTPGVYKQVVDMTCSIPADVTVFDSDSDAGGFVDRIYAGDTCGNVWRINIDDADPANWTVGKLAAIGGSGASERKFLFAPDVVFATGYDAVLLGTGDREHPFDTTVANRFYMFKDDHALNATPGSAIGESIMCNANDPGFASCMTDIAKKGWFLPLSSGEKVVGGSTTLAGATFFGTNLPASAAPGVCTSNLGEARLYAVSFKDASPVLDLNNSGGALTTSDRYAVKAGGGFPPTPIPIVTQLDDGAGGQKKFEVMCTGTQCIQPPAQELEKRYRIYWHMELE
ncbi:MAG: hypothetical protein HYU77_05835 [Betaproteobacteria bacterium]|nr:hypothetical protein [Betaproteobacteria bacterium]